MVIFLAVWAGCEIERFVSYEMGGVNRHMVFFVKKFYKWDFEIFNNFLDWKDLFIVLAKKMSFDEFALDINLFWKFFVTKIILEFILIVDKYFKEIFFEKFFF